MKHLPRHLAHSIGGEEREKIPNLFGIRKGFERAFFEIFLKDLFGNVRGHGRSHKTGIHSIYEDFFAPEFSGEGFGHGDQPTL